MKKTRKNIGRKQIGMLNALISNCKQSDRNIAKEIGVSQPTITRIRQRLEREGIIKAYMAIPDYAKLGFKIGTVIRGHFPDPAKIPNGSAITAIPLFTGKDNLMLITVHKDIDDYFDFLNKLNKIKTVGTGLTIDLFATRALEIKPVRFEA